MFCLNTDCYSVIITLWSQKNEIFVVQNIGNFMILLLEFIAGFVLFLKHPNTDSNRNPR